MYPCRQGWGWPWFLFPSSFYSSSFPYSFLKDLIVLSFALVLNILLFFQVPLNAVLPSESRSSRLLFPSIFLASAFFASFSVSRCFHMTGPCQPSPRQLLLKVSLISSLNSNDYVTQIFWQICIFFCRFPVSGVVCRPYIHVCRSTIRGKLLSFRLT